MLDLLVYYAPAILAVIIGIALAGLLTMLLRQIFDFWRDV